jgi:hypothetical protein
MSSLSPSPERPGVPRRTLAVYAVLTAIMLITLVVASCSMHTARSVAPADGVVRAGSSFLVVDHIVDNVDNQRVMSRAATGDTTAKERGKVRIEQQVAPVNGVVNVQLIKLGHYAAGDFVDTMSMTRDGLRPITERMQFGSTVKTIHYDGVRLHETIQVGDSAPRALDRSFPMPVFGFNQLELVLQSLPLRPGFHAILPLYSEGDDSLELDTATVVKIALSENDSPYPSWTVRFADPAIVSTYVIATLSRRIISYEVQARKSGMHSWIERDSAGQ